MNLPRRELAVRRWLEMVKETQDTHRSSGTEQQCNGGEVGRRRCDGGRNGGRNGGATEGATEARRRAQRRRDGGRIYLLFTCYSVAEQNRQR